VTGLFLIFIVVPSILISSKTFTYQTDALYIILRKH